MAGMERRHIIQGKTQRRRHTIIGIGVHSEESFERPKKKITRISPRQGKGP